MYHEHWRITLVDNRIKRHLEENTPKRLKPFIFYCSMDNDNNLDNAVKFLKEYCLNVKIIASENIKLIGIRNENNPFCVVSYIHFETIDSKLKFIKDGLRQDMKEYEIGYIYDFFYAPHKYITVKAHDEQNQ